jgi:hypothetical protein
MLAEKRFDHEHRVDGLLQLRELGISRGVRDRTCA